MWTQTAILAKCSGFASVFQMVVKGRVRVLIFMCSKQLKSFILIPVDRNSSISVTSNIILLKHQPRETNGSVLLLFVFLKKPLYEVCLMRKRELVDEKSNTVCTHRYADSLLKNTSTKHYKYVVNQKLEHVEDIGFRELLGRIRMVFYKISSLSS